MKLYSKNEDYILYQGNMLDMLEVINPSSIDSIVTDPPYGLTSITKRFGKENSAPAQFGKDGAFSRLSKGFMGKEWDGSGIEYNIETWKKCFEVLKDGGYLLAFGGTRTYHKIASAIEEAGFEIRDCIMWLYGSGFPKSLNISNSIEKNEKYNSNTILNKWKGWGTCLKPAYEPIIVARKPFKGTLVENVIKNGVGGLNIDECRVPAKKGEYDIRHYTNEDCFQNLKPKNSKFQIKPQPDGRFPANVLLTYDETDYNEVCGGFPYGKKNGSINKQYDINNIVYGDYGKCNTFIAYDDDGNASRYFYCAKASSKDREEGLEDFEENIHKITNMYDMPRRDGTIRKVPTKKNIHPTVKPTELMQYLVRLVTPKGGTICDPFMGSGSTGKAVMYENKERNANYKFIGIEITDEYLPISDARIKYAKK